MSQIDMKSINPEDIKFVGYDYINHSREFVIEVLDKPIDSKQLSEMYSLTDYEELILLNKPAAVSKNQLALATLGITTKLGFSTKYRLYIPFGKDKHVITFKSEN